MDGEKTKKITVQRSAFYSKDLFNSLNKLCAKNNVSFHRVTLELAEEIIKNKELTQKIVTKIKKSK